MPCPLGSAIEVVVLSLALASRINQLKRESVEAREEQLRVSQLNEQMVREQNSILEERRGQTDGGVGECQFHHEEYAG